MKELEEFYNNARKAILQIFIILWILYSVLYVFLTEHVIIIPSLWPQPEIVSYALSHVLGYGAPTGLMIAAYFLLMDYVDKVLWKIKFPNYDISGEWTDITTYTKVFDNNGSRNIQMQDLPSSVIINQTCHKVTIEPSVGQHFTWGSLAADWDSNNYLNILYAVEYKTSLQVTKDYPEKRYGFERMHIKTSGLGKKSKPTVMEGKFWHCVRDDGKPIYMGDVIYQR